MSSPQSDADADESSGVTTLRPVLAKPARLLDLTESDSTHYFSASDLLERGKALTVPSGLPEPPPTPEGSSAPVLAPARPSWLAQFRRASSGRKASALLLPLLCVGLLAKPMLEKAKSPTTASKPSAGPTVPIASAEAKPPATPPPSATISALSLPRGVTLVHAAADSVATGDFSRAAALYRELSRREPTNPTYSVAARILSQRARARTP
jgi:hypothetical protein